MKLVDANVWLALAYGGHVHHQRAVSWFDAQGERSCVLCRITQMALLRHLTNPKIMGPNVCDQLRAWQVNGTFVSDPRDIFMDEPASVEVRFRFLTQSPSPRHAVWTDAYLASFAIGHGFELATMDAGFKQFAGLIVEAL